jgi:diguanylate cyclase (GGDEF)-like protein/PAS domain S-box-containing protein
MKLFYGVSDYMKNSVFPKRFDIYKAAEKHMPLKVALIIAGTYTILGACWIIFSDSLLSLWAADKEVYAFLSSIKGIIYVSASALLIFFMVFNALKAISDANNIRKIHYSELEDINKKLAESEEFNNAIINKMLNAYALHRILLDENGQPYDYEFIDVNPSFEKFTGFSKDEIAGKTYREVIKGSSEEETDWVELYGKVATTGEPISFESYTAAFDKWVVVSAYSPRKGYFITVFSDISDLKKNEAELREKHEELTSLYEELTASEEELRQQFEELTNQQRLLKISEERFRLSAEGSNDMIWDFDLENGQQYFSDRWYELLGHEIDESEDKLRKWFSLIHPDDHDHVVGIFDEHLEGKSSYLICECRMRCKSGGYKWFLIRGKALFNRNRKAVRIAGSLTDISDRKKYEDQLRENAYHDSLTGMLNRLALYENFGKLVSTLPHKSVALFFIDSDNFKLINDTMGHSFGDLLIRKMGERLAGLFEGFQNSVYRFGGDEFVFFTVFNRTEEVHRYAREILKSFNSPLKIGENTLSITVSIGIAVYPSNGSNIQELIRNADIALYKAKESGKNCYMLFSDDMHEKVMERMLIERHLRNAIENNELDVYYQPQVEAMTGVVTGFEALLRWKNDELGFVPPLKFIGVAEETRLINPIGKWVLKKACAFLKKVHDTERSYVSIAVNVSIIQLLQEDFVDYVREVLDLSGLAPEFLELEITESILMDSYKIISSNLERLRKLGVRIALDDFGKGYSSLSYLKQLPINTLKIDKCFIDNIHLDKAGADLTGMIVKLGQNMGLTVVAEGVEQQDQLDYLKENGCHKIQGYLISKPLPETEILEFYSEWKQNH